MTPRDGLPRFSALSARGGDAGHRKACATTSEIHAAMRADELMEAGDIDGQAVWKRVLKVVDEWLSELLPEGERIH